VRLIPAGASPTRTSRTHSPLASCRLPRYCSSLLARHRPRRPSYRRPGPVVFALRPSPMTPPCCTTTAQHIFTWLVRLLPLHSRLDAHPRRLHPPCVASHTRHLRPPSSNPSLPACASPAEAPASGIISRGASIAYTTVPSPVSGSLPQPTYLFSLP
jgi:hypothetical protein